MIENRRNKFMSRHLAWFFSAVVMLAVSVPLQALNYEVGGCKTGSGYVNFTTISAAVVGVPAGATVLVCPGVYPEQVTITQPLTLKGIASGNANRAVIAINPNGNLAPNTTSINGLPFYAQVLMQNFTPFGPVNLIGITVDGSGANPGCSVAYVAGIFYASGSSGMVNEVTTRNQVDGGCGVGIWAENGFLASESITIENSSVHNTGGGIEVYSAIPPTLSATIRGNFLSNTGLDDGGDGIMDAVGAQVEGNVITSITTHARFGYNGNGNVSGNTLADIVNVGIGAIDAQSNKLSNVGTAIWAGNVTVKSNTIMNTFCGADFQGFSGGTFSGNVINDSAYGFANWGGPTMTGNPLYNVDTIQASIACPF
jgi:hypothetical protein